MSDNRLILLKLNLILKSAPNISKGRYNKQQQYSFRGIDDFYDTFQPLFAANEVTIGSEILSSSREEKPTKNGGTMVYSIMLIRWKFEAMDGSYVTSDAIGEALDSGDKASNKAMSASLKYALTQRFLVSTGEDADTENHSPEVSGEPFGKQTSSTGPKQGPGPKAPPGNIPSTGPNKIGVPKGPAPIPKATGGVGTFAGFDSGPGRLPTKSGPAGQDTSFNFGPMSSEDDVP